MSIPHLTSRSFRIYSARGRRGDVLVSPSTDGATRLTSDLRLAAGALDPDAVAEAVASAEPEVIVHQLTALSGKMSARDMRLPDRSSAATMTNRLRTEATDHLLAAGRAVGARRFVAHSFGHFDSPARAGRC